MAHFRSDDEKESVMSFSKQLTSKVLLLSNLWCLSGIVAIFLRNSTVLVIGLPVSDDNYILRKNRRRDRHNFTLGEMMKQFSQFFLEFSEDKIENGNDTPIFWK